MKIDDVQIVGLELPYKKPLVTGANRFSTAAGLLVVVRSGPGFEGYGYVDVFPRTGETIGSARYAVERIIRPAVVGQDLRELARLKQEINRMIMGNPRVKAGVDVALHDLLAKNLNIPLYLLLGGKVREDVGIIRMIGLDSPEQMAEDAHELAREGFRAFKIKINGDFDLDVRRVSRIRDAVGDAAFLKVDANETYAVKSSIRLAKKLADLGVEVFEQPVPRSQVRALREVKSGSPIKIEADQSVDSVSEAYRLLQEGAVDSINTSILKLGGISEARQVVELCKVSGVGCVLGNTAGSMVGDAAALHVAVCLATVSPFCEIGEFQRVTGDPFSGLKVDRGVLTVPEGVGLGVELSDRRWQVLADEGILRREKSEVEHRKKGS